MLRSVLALLLIGTLTACASSRPDQREGDPTRLGAEADSLVSAARVDEAAMLDERLDLTDDQEQSVRLALEAYRDALATARGLPDVRSRSALRERARVETDARILATLTGTQRETFETIRSERETELDPLVRRQIAFLTRVLLLTDEQQTAFGPLLTRRLEDLEPIQAQARREGTRGNAQEEIQRVQEQYDAEILALLTAEQAEEYQELVEDRGRRRGRR
ncbi:MAG: hypothetical protein AAF791_06280 [Bacteroidota bacterium]